MSNDSNEQPIPEALREAIKQIFVNPENKIQIIGVILEIQNKEIKELKERIEKLERQLDLKDLD